LQLESALKAKEKAMKKIALVLVLMMFGFSTVVSHAIEVPPELNELNKKALKRFHYKKAKKKNSILLSDGLTKPYPGESEVAASAFLQENHKLLFLSPGLSELKLDRKSRDPLGVDVEYERYYKGIPVYRSGVIVSLDKENRIYSVVSGVGEIVDLNVEPVIKPEELQDVLKQTAPEFGRIEGKPELLIYFLEDSPVLAYMIRTNKTSGEGGPYQLIVDSSTGKILQKIRAMIVD
jgi:Zn-dependent metalloprotease